MQMHVQYKNKNLLHSKTQIKDSHNEWTMNLNEWNARPERAIAIQSQGMLVQHYITHTLIIAPEGISPTQQQPTTVVMVDVLLFMDESAKWLMSGFAWRVLWQSLFGLVVQSTTP